MLHQLSIKTHEFLRKRRDWHGTCQPLHPGHDVVHSTGKRRREPPIWTATVEKARLPVAGGALPPAPSDSAAAVQHCMDPLPTVCQLTGPDHPCATQDGQASRLTSRINFQAIGMHHSIFPCAVVKNNGKWMAPEY